MVQIAKNIELPPLVAPAVIARWLGVSAKSVSEMAERGTIPRPYVLGKTTLRYNAGEVLELLERRRCQWKIKGQPTASTKTH